MPRKKNPEEVVKFLIAYTKELFKNKDKVSLREAKIWESILNVNGYSLNRKKKI